MVDTELLKKHAAAYKITKDTAGEYHKQLFTKHPELASFYDAEDLDPDSIPKSSKFVMMGQAELSYFFRLPQVFNDERQWRSALACFKEQYSDVGFPIKEFNVTDALLAALEKNAGGVSAEQKKNWEELLNKAYADMHTWGWY